MTSAKARLTPSWAIWRMVSTKSGCQLRLPQYTVKDGPWTFNSSISAASRARFWALIGLMPPNSS